MTERNDRSFPALGAVLAIPCSLLSGFFVGLIAPLAAVAAIVAGVRLVTGKVPFLGNIWEDDEGERHLSFKLVPPDEAKDLFEEQKEQIGGEIVKMKDEIQVIIEEAKAQSATG